MSVSYQDVLIRVMDHVRFILAYLSRIFGHVLQGWLPESSLRCKTSCFSMYSVMDDDYQFEIFLLDLFVFSFYGQSICWQEMITVRLVLLKLERLRKAKTNRSLNFTIFDKVWNYENMEHR